MTRSSRARLALLTVLAVVASTLALLPALGDPGPGAENAVRLHMGTNGEFFFYDTGETKGYSPVAGNENHLVQPIGTNRCAISNDSLAGALARIGPAPANPNNLNNRPGVNAFGIGFKTGSSQGTPCGRVDATEQIEFSVPTTGPIAGIPWNGLRLDLELKGNAIVVVTLSQSGGEPIVFRLFSGTAADESKVIDKDLSDGVHKAFSTAISRDAHCLGGSSDSGPDSGANDNCQWHIDAGVSFDNVVLTATQGEFSVEGSGDYGSDPAFDTLFYLSDPIGLECDEGPYEFESDDEPTYRFLVRTDGDCPTKLVFFSSGVSADEQFVELLPVGNVGQVYAFLEQIEWLPVAPPGEAGSQIPFVLQYDDIPPFELLRDAPWCLQDPRMVDGAGVPQFDLDNDLVASEIAAFMAEGTSTVLPVGHTTCIIEATFLTVGADDNGTPLVRATYWLFNLGDGKRTFQ